MRKPASLRAALERFVPAFRDDPARLSMFVDRGTVAARPGALAFEYRYTLNIVAQDFAGSPDLLMVPLLAWIGEHQPDLLQRGDAQPFRFESELLDATTADVSIYVELDEAVLVEPKDGGGFTTARVAATAAPDDFGIGCVPLWQLLLNADEVARTADPAFPG